MMIRLLAVIFAVALAWAGAWVWMSMSLRGDIETWFDDRRDDGWAAEYSDLSISGFPNRLDVTLTDLVLADPDSGLVWETPFLQMFRLIYRPGHHIIAFADTQAFGLKGEVYQITSEGLRASVVSDAEGRILRSNLESAVLNIAGPEGAAALAGVNLGASRGDSDSRYLLGLTVDQIAGLGGADSTAQAVSVRLVADFDRPWRITPQTDRPQPRRLDLRLAELRADPLTLRMTGDLDLDPEGRASGEVTLRADNWRDGLAEARAKGTLPDWLADLTETSLGALAALGNGRSLDLILRMDRGQVWLGILPMGTIPPMRLP
jgi:hypothetical protein